MLCTLPGFFKLWVLCCKKGKGGKYDSESNRHMAQAMTNMAGAVGDLANGSRLPHLTSAPQSPPRPDDTESEERHAADGTELCSFLTDHNLAQFLPALRGLGAVRIWGGKCSRSPCFVL